MTRGGGQLEVTGDIRKSRLGAGGRTVCLLPRSLEDPVS